MESVDIGAKNGTLVTKDEFEINSLTTPTEEPNLMQFTIYLKIDYCCSYDLLKKEKKQNFNDILLNKGETLFINIFFFSFI